MKSELLKRLAGLLKEVAPRTPELENSEAHLMRDFGLDSLDVIQLLFRIEEEFGIKIPEADIDQEELMLLGNLVRYVEARSQA